ncbi:hydrogenase accessory protein HypB [Marinilabiliaceae bacterium JC017]|nr:hydrogenase accessory protein HypB [Marinilabiliaceae bacterium JC017]
MCDTCGCQSEDEATYKKPGDTNHDHTHSHPLRHVLDVNRDLLHDNDLMAERNRGFFEARKIMAINLVSSPGSGKTTLLEKTISALHKDIRFFVIAGDQNTLNDATRIEKTGTEVIQINTGTGCHLDAEMVHMAIRKLDPPRNTLLVIENVGNLVCPALFDLGETKRIVMISVTEGEDKPVKYPHMFKSSDVCIVNKTDLLPHLDFDLAQLRGNIKKVNHQMKVFELSALKGEGLQQWLKWLTAQKTP